jgi:hypothetical protein
VTGPASGGFLSEEWLSHLSESLRSLCPPGSEELALGVLVTEVPPSGEDVSYLIRLGGQRPASAEFAPLEQADVVLIEAFEDARALADGEAGAGELLETGRVKLRGDVSRLVRSGDLLAVIGAGFAATGTGAERP